MENPPFEDVCPIEHGDFSNVMLVFRGVFQGNPAYFEFFIRMSRGFFSGELLDYDGGWIWQAEELKHFISHTIHGTGIFTYTFTTKINHSCRYIYHTWIVWV